MSELSVGDIVWYHPGPDDPLVHFVTNHGNWPLAAIVVCVYDEGCVNLCVFDPGGLMSHRAMVKPRQGASDRAEIGFFEAKKSLPKAATKKRK